MAKVYQWQKDFLEYGIDVEDIESGKLAMKCFQNSCHSTLLIQVNEKYDEIDLMEQGGIVYLKIAFDLMFVMTHEVVMSLSAWIKRFGEQCLSMVKGDNVSIIMGQFLAMSEHLVEVNKLYHMMLICV